LEIAKEKKVLDVGGAGGFRKTLNDFGAEFIGEYISLDIDPGKNPDIVGDAHNLPVSDSEFDAILCISVIEHLKNPFQAVSEMHRVLKPGGKAFFHIPFLYPFHGYTDCPDYFRFTQQGIKELFKDFTEIRIVRTSGFFGTFTNFVPRAVKPIYRPIARIMDGFFKGRSTSSGFYVFVRK